MTIWCLKSPQRQNNNVNDFVFVCISKVSTKGDDNISDSFYYLYPDSNNVPKMEIQICHWACVALNIPITFVHDNVYIIRIVNGYQGIKHM